MKIFTFGTSMIAFLLMISLSSSSYALVEEKTTSRLPPYYLQVPGWQKCTKVKEMGSWQSVCMPKKKPRQCLSASWQALQAKGQLSPC